jgi:hypothetical protein
MSSHLYVNETTPAGDFETITISSTSLGFTAAKTTIAQAGGFTKRAVKVLVTVESNPIRIRLDGTAPTASVGHLLNAGDSYLVEGEGNVTNFRMIRQSGTDATVMCSYFYNR